MGSLLRERLQAAGSVPKTGRKRGPSEVADALEKVRRNLYSRIDSSLLAKKEDPGVQQQFRRLIGEILERETPALPRTERPSVIAQLMDDVLGYGPIQSLIDDPEVTEVMVNRWDSVYYEKGGKIYKSDITFRDDEHVRNVIDRIVGPLGRRADESSPIVDARLPDGSRVHAAIRPVSIDGASITIRKFGRRFTMEELIAAGTLSEEAARFIRACVEGALNIIVSGGTGSGKTTVLNCISSFVPEGERIITIEDAAELQLQQEHVLRREARPPNIEGKGEITIRDLLKAALRERPDRIIIGECRGEEALDMLQAMNTGHDGSLTTIHANSPEDVISRLETLVLMAKELPIPAIRRQIAAAVDLIIHVARLRDGSRRVVSISEVGEVLPDGNVEINEIFTFKIEREETGRIEGKLVPTGYAPRFLDKLAWHGVSLPKDLFKEVQA